MKTINDFLKHLEDKDFSAATVENYRFALNSFSSWFCAKNGDFSPERVTPYDVKFYKSHLESKKLKPGTINNNLSALKYFFDYCVEKKIIISSPVVVKRAKQQATNTFKWLTRQQTYSLLRKLEEKIQIAQSKGNTPTYKMAVRNHAAYSLMLHAGLRVSEVTALTTEDIKMSEKKGLVIVRHGKGNKYREVPLNLDARKSLSRWMAFTEENKLFPLTKRTIEMNLEALAREAGLDAITPHQLRHTFGKNLIDAGVSLDRVAALMGHDSVDTTKIYTTPSQSDLENEVAKIAWSE